MSTYHSGNITLHDSINNSAYTHSLTPTPFLSSQKSISVPIVELIIVRTDDGSNPAGRALSENGTSGNLSAITILFPRQFELEDEDFTDEILDRRKNIVNIGEILAGAFTLNPLKIIRGALGWAPDGIREGIYNGILGIANPATTAKPKVANATALNVTLSGNATVPTTLLPSTTLESTTENNDPEDENEEGEESSA